MRRSKLILETVKLLKDNGLQPFIPIMVKHQILPDQGNDRGSFRIRTFCLQTKQQMALP